MGVPGHHENDFIFAKAHEIPIKYIINQKENGKS